MVAGGHMCRRPPVFLISLLVATMNVSAQDSAPPLRSSSPKEKAQALAALTEARGAVFPQRRKDEARQLLARIAPLLAAAGDTAGAQDVLTLLPANERDAIQLEIVAAQLRSREIAAALETATTITTDNAQAAAESRLIALVLSRQSSSNWPTGCRKLPSPLTRSHTTSSRGSGCDRSACSKRS